MIREMSKGGMMKKIRTVEELKLDIQSLVDYNWDAEQKDYEEQYRDVPINQRNGGHIFEVIQRLQHWIE